MKWIAAFFLSFQVLVWPVAAMAQGGVAYRSVVTTTWVEEFDPNTGRWVRIEETVARATDGARYLPASSKPGYNVQTGSKPLASPYEKAQSPRAHLRSNISKAIANYGPFVVLDHSRAALIGSTDSASPAQFDAMLRDYPALSRLEMIEAPGTSNDLANLALGRRIRSAGLSTHVPDGGSVRSGAVELFLAGVTQSIEPGAQFAVHSWLDNFGRQPHDFAPDAPENRLYIDYYVEMGMDENRARAFYAMTNSVPHHSAKWLRAADMRKWVGLAGANNTQLTTAQPIERVGRPVIGPSFERLPAIAYADLCSVTLMSVELPIARSHRQYAFLDS